MFRMHSICIVKPNNAMGLYGTLKEPAATALSLGAALRCPLQTLVITNAQQSIQFGNIVVELTTASSVEVAATQLPPVPWDLNLFTHKQLNSFVQSVWSGFKKSVCLSFTFANRFPFSEPFV